MPMGYFVAVDLPKKANNLKYKKRQMSQKQYPFVLLKEKLYDHLDWADWIQFQIITVKYRSQEFPSFQILK